MSGVLFLQSEVTDPYALYAEQRAHGTVQYDASHRLWAVYSHAGCKAVLASDQAHVPRSALDGLQDEAALIASHLVRLANPPAHARLRRTAQQLFEYLDGEAHDRLIRRLLPAPGTAFDWAAACRPLPPLALMHGLGFAASSIEVLLPQVDALAKLMLPAKTGPMLAVVQHAARVCWPVLQNEARRLAGTRDDAFAANLGGLLIQSLDATRGLLSNALLAALALPAPPSSAGAWLSHVQETLRWDPPIQNTRRVLAQQMTVEGATLPAGAQLLLVLAAANRDTAVFDRPDRFDALRGNGDAHLTFGFGAHACVAREYASLIAAQALAMLFESGRVVLSAQPVAYAPMVNARLPEALHIHLE